MIAAARAQLEAPNPDSAVALLEIALRPGSDAAPGEVTRAWVLYGIAQLLRDQVSLARQAFRQALQRDPGLRVDSLSFFHDALEREFGAERAVVAPPAGPAAPAAASLLELTLTVPADTTLPVPGGILPLEARVTRRARVVVAISPDADRARVVWSDTQDIRAMTTGGWNLRAPDGSPIAPGRYGLRATATDSGGAVSRTIERLLEISAVPVDTASHPPLLTAADFQPEARRIPRRSAAGLTAGLVLAGAVAVLPTVIGNAQLNSGLAGDGTAYAVAGALSLATVVGFVTGYRTEALPENAQANRELRERDARERRAIVEANAGARARASVRVRVAGADR